MSQWHLRLRYFITDSFDIHIKVLKVGFICIREKSSWSDLNFSFGKTIIDQVEVVDTVGCGDSFVAAIALGYIRNMPLVNTLTIANAVGAATAMGCGAGRNVAKRHQVVDLIKSSKLNDEGNLLKELLAENPETPKVNLLSKGLRKDGSNKQQVEVISMEKVVSELLPELELGRCCVKASS